jgi:hypothetical protein
MNKENMFRNTLKGIGPVALAAVLLVGCDPKGKDGEDKGDAKSDTVATIMKVGGSMFSIPSPVQTALLIERSGIGFDKSILNPSTKVTNYATNYQKALNLGVYGADVGYVTIYDQSQEALKYLNSIRKLSDELGITGAFDQKTVQRFEANFGVRDSMLNLVNVAYRNSDAFLKDNDRLNVGSLIIAGGWVESLYFTTQLAKKKKDQAIITRIGEQKYTLNNLIKMLAPYNDQPEYKALIDDLIELAYDFDAVDIQYTYVKPVVDVANKTTTINSSTKVVITDQHLAEITKAVEALRNKIVGQ